MIDLYVELDWIKEFPDCSLIFMTRVSWKCEIEMPTSVYVKKESARLQKRIWRSIYLADRV